MKIEELLKIWSKRRSKYDLAKAALVKERKEYKLVKRSLRSALQTQKIVQDIAEQIQAQAYHPIENIVNRCLTMIFPEDPYKLKILTVRARNKTEIRIQLVRDKLIIEDPLDEAGGAIADVVSFAMRLACLLLLSSKRLLVLDEPFKNVSKSRLSKVRRMLTSLASELDVQILIVTHIQELMTGKIIEID